jgi:carbamoyltransferase
MLVLGLSYKSHDAAAALIDSGSIIGAVGEERFNRKKHSSDFPIQAIRYCINTAGVKFDDIDKVALFVEPHTQYKIGLHNLVQAFPKSIL